ncbi:MAG: VanZ family protein [Akkermansiaceae bacterium]|nr:VanZ family protein [Akkermansiaceae bacterium]
MKLPGLFRYPKTWLIAFGVWFATLWLLSAGHPTPPGSFDIPFMDKICHFGYFLGGGGLLAAGLFCRRPGSPNWRRIILVVVAMSATVGALDEYHQTHTPGRSGNDPWDWLADVLGGTAGALVFTRFHRVLRPDEDPEKNAHTTTA